MSAAPSVAPTAETGCSLDFDEIRRILPHREPFILVDRVLSLEPRRRIRCLKSISGADPVFAWHFPSQALFPGAFLLEAMAQATLLVFIAGTPEPDTTRSYVLGRADVRWLTPVRPGDRVELRAEVEKAASTGSIVRCEARVEGRCVARARLIVAPVDLQG